MGYPNFGKVKTIVLPVPSVLMSLDEYKEKYGIDLRDFVEIVENEIHPKNGLPNTAVYTDDIALDYSYTRLNSLKKVSAAPYVAGQADGKLDFIYMGDEDGGESIRISASKDGELSFENLKIGPVEL